MTTELAFVRQRVGALLSEIGSYFAPGAKLTVLVRPEIPGKDADFVLTSDTLPAAIASLQARHAAGAPTPTPEDQGNHA